MEKIELVKDILSDKIPVRDVKNTEEPIKDNYCEVRTEVNIVEEQLTSPTHLPRRDAPVANVRYRRSGSAGGDKWLEHRPANPTPLGTVFQPTYKRHKSVVKLTNMKDVVKSSQGGAQVIFDDVEKLKQESPLKTNTPKSILKRSNMDHKAGHDKKSKKN
ncbi:pavarotti [Carabus blaptoides fortunei]